MRQRLTHILVLSLLALSASAGGILTNTNQNIAFNRMMSREASIGIDGVYSNPAGVAFMKPGLYLSVNWQMPYQKRYITSSYPLYQLNGAEPAAAKRHTGHAYCPVIPSVQAVYNTGKWSFQANLAIGGAGGKCKFDDGLGSLERTVANTAAGLSQMAGAMDQAHQAAGLGPTALGAMFPTGSYTFNSNMDGQQFYWGLSLGAAYKLNTHLAVYAGLRGVYAKCCYNGFVGNIKVDGHALSPMLGGDGAADISLDCDQTGTGFTPIIGIDYKLGRWNFSARYEFKTRIRLKNDANNHTPSLDQLPATLIAAGVNPVFLQNPQVQQQMAGFAAQFNGALQETLGEFEDGKSIKADIPSLLTIGAGYEVTDRLRLNVGFHYFGDKSASLHNHREKTLHHGTIEYNAGIEYDLIPALTVSTGWQNTNYGMSDGFMDDKSFSVDSNSWGLGGCIHASKRVDINVAYFHSFYKNYKRQSADAMTSLPVSEDFTRNNNVFGVGVDIKF